MLGGAAGGTELDEVVIGVSGDVPFEALAKVIDLPAPAAGILLRDVDLAGGVVGEGRVRDVTGHQRGLSRRR